jgi:proline iminopeptidase
MGVFRTFGDRALSYQTWGGDVSGGRLMVLLPGGPGLHPPAFYEPLRGLPLQQLVFCPRGTGQSHTPDAPSGYEIAGYVEDVEALRRHLGVEQLTLYGSSHGATTALAYAHAHPDRVERMILAGGPARMDHAFQRSLGDARHRFETAVPDGRVRLAAADTAATTLRQAHDDDTRHRSLRSMMDCFIAHQSPAHAVYLDRLAMAPTNFAAPGPMANELMAGLDLLRDADRIHAPTLVLTGELDVRVPSEHMAEIAEALPGARLIRFPGAGHLLHAEARAQWIEVVGDFLC